MELDRIYNMDCLEGMRQMADGSVDCIVSDPPYVVGTTGAGMYKQDDKRYVKELEAADIVDGFSTEILDEMCRLMKAINVCLFCSQKQIIPLLDYFVKGKGCNYNLLSWHKSNPIPACGNKYITDTEFVLFFREKGVKVYGTTETKKTWWVTPLNVTDKQKYGHPTCKPESIVECLIKNHSQEKDVVLDPFIGSGTTAIAALKNKRHFIGFEIDATYYTMASRRIEAEQSQLKLQL